MSMSNNGEDDVLAQPTFELPLPPPDGYRAEDLDRIPNLPPEVVAPDSEEVSLPDRASYIDG